MDQDESTNCVVPSCKNIRSRPFFAYCGIEHEQLDSDRAYAAEKGLFEYNNHFGPPWPLLSLAFGDDGILPSSTEVTERPAAEKPHQEAAVRKVAEVEILSRNDLKHVEREVNDMKADDEDEGWIFTKQSQQTSTTSKKTGRERKSGGFAEGWNWGNVGSGGSKQTKLTDFHKSK